jgi:hypothetical protein
MSCPDCGAQVARDAVEAHSCDEKRALDFHLLQLRTEIDAFDDQLSAWLATTRGRFETWLAARDRQAGPNISTA